MLTIAGSMALMLGVVGLYGVIAYSVSQQRREIGIRNALGGAVVTIGLLSAVAVNPVEALRSE